MVRALYRIPDRDRGFTLVELLVAISVLGLLMLSLGAGLNLISRGTDAGERRAEQTAQWRLAQSFLRRHLQAAVWDGDRGKEQSGLFEGQTGQLRLVAEMPAYPGLGGLYELHIALRGDEGEGRLEMSRRLRHPDVFEDSRLVQSEAVVLIDGLSAVAFEYYGAGEDQPATWRDEWTGESGLPSRLRIRLSGSDQRPWPSLEVRLPTSAGGKSGQRNPLPVEDD